MNQTNKQNDEWYRDGLHFECTQCGRCCTGPSGYVWFTPAEAQALAADLGITVEAFLETYTRPLRGRRSLKEIRSAYGFDCIFLDRESVPGKALCRVYQSRPMQCRTWPFWRENLESPDSWAQQAHNVCPGMNHGRLVPIEQIRIQRDKLPPDA